MQRAIGVLKSIDTSRDVTQFLQYDREIYHENDDREGVLRAESVQSIYEPISDMALDIIHNISAYGGTANARACSGNGEKLTNVILR